MVARKRVPTDDRRAEGAKALQISIEFAENFVQNLETMQTWYAQFPDSSAYEQLIRELFDVTLPMLKRFPRAARRFELESQLPRGMAAKARIEKHYPNAELREVMLKRHVAVYAISGAAISFLAVRDFRQIDYDFSALRGS